MQKEFLPWLEKIAVAVDRLLNNGTHVQRQFQKMIIKADKKCKISGPERSRIPITRTLLRMDLTLEEKYSWLGAIHDVVSEDATPVDPYSETEWKRRNPRKPKSDGKRLLAAVYYANRLIQVRKITKDYRKWLKQTLADVAKDLGLPNPLQRGMNASIIQQQSASQITNVGRRKGAKTYDPTIDAKYANAWSTNKYITHLDCANALNVPLKDFKHALDRHRKKHY